MQTDTSRPQTVRLSRTYTGHQVVVSYVPDSGNVVISAGSKILQEFTMREPELTTALADFLARNAIKNLIDEAHGEAISMNADQAEVFTTGKSISSTSTNQELRDRLAHLKRRAKINPDYFNVGADYAEIRYIVKQLIKRGC